MAGAQKLFTQYHKRPIRFLEVYPCDLWHIKTYSISARQEVVDSTLIDTVKQELPGWLRAGGDYDYQNYKIAILIIHEGRDANYAVLAWWVEENMLRQYTYRSVETNPFQFELVSTKGLSTCIWELTVLWFERNAWIDFILTRPSNPDFEGYLKAQVNVD